MEVERFVGYTPATLLESVAKRLVEGVAGRGGLEAFCQFLDQLDWIEGLPQLRLSIKNNTVFFESALSKCTKEMLKRPEPVRRREIGILLGASCPKCGFTTTLWWTMELQGKCPMCSSALTPTAATATRQLLAQKIEVTPETMLMHVAYDRLAQAYVDAYKALQLVLQNFAEIFGWEKFRVDQRMLNYICAYLLGRMAGEQKISREEKECLQFLVMGNLAGIPAEEAEKLLRLGISVVKYGYLYEVLGAAGALHHYQKTVAEYDSLHDAIYSRIRRALHILYGEASARRIRLKKTLGGYYAPCLLVPRENWVGGQLAGEILLEPVYRLPIFPKADFGAIQTVYGPLGSGKTFLLSSLICYSVLAKRQVVLIPLNDESNSFSLASLPLFSYSKRTAKLSRVLEMMDIEPQGVPCLTVTVLQQGEKVDDVNKHPPTIYDRILEVENPANFHLDFNELLNELQAIAENYGYSQPVGVIAFRNLQRKDSERYVDVEVASNVVEEFNKWRKGNLNRPIHVVIDEISYMAASQAITYARDKLRGAATITDFIKESRRNLISLSVATQQPIEIVPPLRNESTNIFFRNLAVSKDKTRSQIDFLLESIQLKDESLKPVIRDINNQGILPKGFWFWYSKTNYNVNIIRPCPPTFTIHDPKRTPLQIYKLYEKTTGEKVLLDSWKNVKRLKPATPSKRTQATEIAKSFLP